MSHILVECDRGGRVLEKHVGHANLELPELGHLPNDLACDEMASPRRRRNGDGSLSPGRLASHDLRIAGEASYYSQ